MTKCFEVQATEHSLESGILGASCSQDLLGGCSIEEIMIVSAQKYIVAGKYLRQSQSASKSAKNLVKHV